MKRQSILVMGAVLGLGVFGVATQKTVANVTLLETAPEVTGAGTTNGGIAIAEYQWLGARFELEQTYRITDIGGHVKSGVIPSGFGFEDRSVFAAIVPVSESTGFPNDNLLGEAVFVNVFEAPYNYAGPFPYQVPDTVIETDFVLEAGNYALVFGSGLFGATGGGWMPVRDVWTETPWFFRSYGMDGFANQPRDPLARFFVHGEVIPAPGALLLCGIGAGLVGWMRRSNIIRQTW